MFTTPRPKAHDGACAICGVTASADGEAGRSAILKASCRMEVSKEKTNIKGLKKPMVWTDQHNDMLLEEMYLFGPWKYKRGSKQRGQVLERISESLNEHESPRFTLNQKSVRDPYILLEKEQKNKIREEKKASGIAPQHTPFDDSMTEIIERFKERC
ncbi:hypothetical protein AWC38_SpisGene17722 [Stylophora pistillata]|uniref:Uncharacterized protein n=1 Tax=Stylophora pistillata TaxID=50429 RepID=A0A2B4RNS8_STYPI|nr:hypothetical protein AWC38_SpisGene17722 [Stylophora pistillata]